MLGPLGRGNFDGDIAPGPLGGGEQNCPGEGARAGAGLDHGEIRRAAEAPVLGIDPACQHGTEQGANLGRGEEVPPPPGLPARGVETVIAVKGDAHELVEAQGAAGCGLGGRQLADDRGISRRRHR